MLTDCSYAYALGAYRQVWLRGQGSVSTVGWGQISLSATGEQGEGTGRWGGCSQAVAAGRWGGSLQPLGGFLRLIGDGGLPRGFSVGRPVEELAWG